MKTILFIVIALVLYSCTADQEPVKESYLPTWESVKTHETPDWFRDAKFGIYFHWGSWCNVDDPDWEKFLSRLRNVCLRLAIASIEMLGHTGSLAWEMTNDALLVEMPVEIS